MYPIHFQMKKNKDMGLFSVAYIFFEIHILYSNLFLLAHYESTVRYHLVSVTIH